METLVIIPTYNERETIVAAIEGVLIHPGMAALVVDDDSPDGTADAVSDLVARQPEGLVSLLKRPRKSGLGSAYRDGFRQALDRGFHCVVQMDADGSHDPADIAALVAAVRDGSQVAIGSRRVVGGRIEGWAPHRHVMSAGAMLLARHALGLTTRDITSGFRCFRAEVVVDLLAANILSDGYAFQEEVIFHCERKGFRITEIPVVFRDRLQGSSKLGVADVKEFLATIWRLRGKKLP